MQLHLNETIRSLRKQRGLTQEQLAEAMGVSIGAVSKWESGQSNPDLSLLPELADFFECSVDVLLDYELRSHSRSEAVSRIRQAEIDKDYETGIQEAKKALTKYPNSFSVIYQCATIYDQSGTETQNKEQMQRAITLYERCIRLIDQNTDERISFEKIQNSIGGLYMFQGEYERAIQHLKKHNICGVNDTAIANILQVQHKYEDALPILSDSLLRSTIDLVTGGFVMTLCLANLGKFEEGISLCHLLMQHMLNMTPKGKTSACQIWVVILGGVLADFLLCQGKQAEAEAALQESIGLARKFDQNPSFHREDIRFFYGESCALATSFGTNAEAALDQILRKFDLPKRDHLLEVYDKVRTKL